MTPEEVTSTDTVQLLCTKSFSKEFLKEWGPVMEPFMKKGWATWAEVEHYEDRLVEDTLLVENNEYEINFPPENFEVIID
jgi:hypothetical protein